MSEEKIIPVSELDLTFSMTEPAIGKEVNERLDNYLTTKKTRLNKKTGINETTIISEMDKFDYYKRDLRFSNLSVGEVNRAQEWLNHAGRNLRFTVGGKPMVRAFSDALMVVMSTTELNQSKGGFFRKMFATVRNENVNTSIEPKKRSWTTSNKQNKGGYE